MHATCADSPDVAPFPMQPPHHPQQPMMVMPPQDMMPHSSSHEMQQNHCGYLPVARGLPPMQPQAAERSYHQRPQEQQEAPMLLTRITGAPQQQQVSVARPFCRFYCFRHFVYNFLMVDAFGIHRNSQQAPPQSRQPESPPEPLRSILKKKPSDKVIQGKEGRGEDSVEYPLVAPASAKVERINGQELL
jgi:hypothetical protein